MAPAHSPNAMLLWWKLKIPKHKDFEIPYKSLLLKERIYSFKKKMEKLLS